ncbi:hypothetical protein D3C78_1614410 [compost metagenome]
MNAKEIPTTAKSAINHHSCSASEILITIWVKAGNSAPNPAKTLSNCGTTLISKIADTMTATTSTEIG